MSSTLGKRFLESPLALALTGVALRAYRAVVFGGFLWRHDPRLVRLLRSREPAVLVCWHQDFAHTMGYVSRFSPRRPTYVLASASRDGGIAAAAAEAVGFKEAVRGSSAERGAAALLRLARLGQDPRRPSLAVVGDGPRPPARALKPGALLLAQVTGAPIWLVRSSWHPDVALERSWARFHLPRPWSRGVVMADGPIPVPRDLDRDGLEALRSRVEARLEALASRADAAAVRAWGRGDRRPLDATGAVGEDRVGAGSAAPAAGARHPAP